MDQRAVKREIKNSTTDELQQWRKHAEKCLHYYVKYPNEYEVSECQYIISHIDRELERRK